MLAGKRGKSEPRSASGTPAGTPVGSPSTTPRGVRSTRSSGPFTPVPRLSILFSVGGCTSNVPSNYLRMTAAKMKRKPAKTNQLVAVNQLVVNKFVAVLNSTKKKKMMTLIKKKKMMTIPLTVLRNLLLNLTVREKKMKHEGKRFMMFTQEQALTAGSAPGGSGGKGGKPGKAAKPDKPGKDGKKPKTLSEEDEARKHLEHGWWLECLAPVEFFKDPSTLHKVREPNDENVQDILDQFQYSKMNPAAVLIDDTKPFWKTLKKEAKTKDLKSYVEELLEQKDRRFNLELEVLAGRHSSKAFLLKLEQERVAGNLDKQTELFGAGLRITRIFLKSLEGSLPLKLLKGVALDNSDRHDLEKKQAAIYKFSNQVVLMHDKYESCNRPRKTHGTNTQEYQAYMSLVESTMEDPEASRKWKKGQLTGKESISLEVNDFVVS